MRISDWSSDVCSSDLDGERGQHHKRGGGARARRWGGGGGAVAGKGRFLGVQVGPPRTVSVRILRLPLPRVPGAWSRSDRGGGDRGLAAAGHRRSEEHTSELQSLMRISYAVFCLKKKTKTQ